MKEYQGLVFEDINVQDIDMLTAIMKRAFDEDTRIHLGKESGGPPGYDNGEFVRHWVFEDKTTTSYKVLKDGKAIGAVILFINTQTQENFLGTIFIDPALENKGVGRIVWDFVEHEYPDTKIWRTETPIFSHRNHHFYINKCGFHVVKIENPREIDNGDGSFKLEKVMK
ncbi:MAG: GNAT family N-acetyltransferase [Oscillospiraceae bacterium]|nr:GNAT family N-acetyltransferase [Oscillospiraceae bacterium]